MAARSVFKLFSKTYSYTINSQPPSGVQTAKQEQTIRRQQGSISYSPDRQHKGSREQLRQTRTLSKSLKNLKDNEYQDEEEYEAFYEPERSKVNRNVFPPPKDVRVRDAAREFVRAQEVEETNEEGNPIYELGECSRSQENFYDVFNYMRRMEREKMSHSFMHLQPNSIKPYGSFENTPQLSNKKPMKIVYPKMPTLRADSARKPKIDEIQYQEYSSCSAQRDPSIFETMKKASVVEPKTSDHSRMKYSTNTLKRKPSEKFKLSSSRSSFSRPSSTALLTKKSSPTNSKQYHDGTTEGQLKKFNYRTTSDTQAKTLSRINFNRVINASREIFLHQVRTNAEDSKGCHQKDEATEPACERYVKIKLSECEDACGKPAKCKPIKKIRFGSLPKMPTSDCPCIEDAPLKPGRPLARITKRFDIPDRDNTCSTVPCEAQPRADQHYKIVQKQLPVLKPQECFPCDPPEMTDFSIRRLPKMKLSEPPPKCPCLPDCDPCPPRADAGFVMKPKVLPKFENNDCPCIEDVPSKSVPLRRLVAKDVREPPKKVCPVPCTEMNPDRADYHMTAKNKELPVLKGDCACVPPPPMEEGTPFKRLKKMTVKEPPRVCPPPPCDSIERADDNLPFKPKKLPLFETQDCPCVDLEPPVDVPALKRLVPKYTPKEKEKYCPPPHCEIRADDGLKVKRKQLPAIEVQDCPCVEPELLDCPPLKKLIPRPVFAPKCPVVKECTMPRADEPRKVEIPRKTLPPFPSGDCPCVEPIVPEDVPPLKKLIPRPVFVKPCPPKIGCSMVKRADEDLKMEAKQLPKLEAPDCPCDEALPPEDVKPLRRLKRKHVPEPAKICPKVACEDMPRADEDDWMYWKCVEVAPCEGTPEATNNISKRSFSTVSRRHYSTYSTLKSEFFDMRYNIPSIAPMGFKHESHDVIIDIKPSAPLVLTQKPLQHSKSEPVDCVAFVIYKNNGLGKSKQESSSEISLIFNNRSRFISTCTVLYEQAEREKGKDLMKDHQTPSCECPPNDRHLQPKHPILPDREEFIKIYPTDQDIQEKTLKGMLYSRARKEGASVTEEANDVECSRAREEGAVKEEEVLEDCKEEEVVADCKSKEKPEKQFSLWGKIVDYFKAKDCPSPEEFKRMRLKEAAERAARKAGLCVYDPKEMLRRNEKELPKVITADSVREECSK